MKHNNSSLDLQEEASRQERAEEYLEIDAAEHGEKIIKRKVPKSNVQTESVEEFLKRGGKITRVTRGASGWPSKPVKPSDSNETPIDPNGGFEISTDEHESEQ